MKQIVPLVIFIAILAVVVFLNIYLARRFAWYFGSESVRPYNILFAALTVFMIGGIAVFTNASGSISNILYSTAAVGLGVMLYLIMAVLLGDVLNLVIKLPPIYYGISTILIAVVIAGYGLLNARNLKTVQLEIAIPGLQKEVKVMHLTDIHIGHWHGKKYLQRIVDETNKQQADFVFITGDLFDGKIRLNDESLEPLKQLSAPVYFVEGNHDGYTGASNIKARLRKIGVHVMENQVVKLDDFQLIGLNHMVADEKAINMHATGDQANIRKVLAELEIDRDSPSILLHHSPDGMKYANEKGIDLYLAGHTHAGQLFPINYLNDFIFTYNKGLHDYNETRIYVSQGAGTFGPPMRVGTRSEITLIKLTPSL